MKNIKVLVNLFLCLSLAFIASSCKDNEEQLDRTYNHTEPPVLQSSTPANNGTSPLFETDKAELVFDRNVTLVDLSKITLNGTAVKSASPGEKSLIITFEREMQENTTYTLTLAKGAIKGVPGILNQEDVVVKFTTSTAPEVTKILVMPNASSQAQKVYNYLIDNNGKNIISGAMAKVDWNTEEADRINRWTQKYPALNGFDYIHHYGNWVDYNNTTVVESWWNNKGLVSIMWHWNVPVSEGSTDYGFYYTGKNSGAKETAFDITKAVEAGTYENTKVKADMDIIAGYLLALQAKNIPVIWRPLHEGAGGWFWWGAKGGDAYKKLWIMMFDTFKAKGINNLIWVWTTETGDNDWYPGDAYVDIIGRDIYNNTDPQSLLAQNWKIRKQYPTKIVTLSECGNVADIADQSNAGAKWSWFMPWYDYNATDTSTHAHATKEFWKKAVDSDKVITRDELPSLK